MLLLIFSLVDYPLRMPALSCVFALLCACLLRPRCRFEPGTERGPFIRSEAPLLDDLQCKCGRPCGARGGRGACPPGRRLCKKPVCPTIMQIAQGWAPWSTTAHEVLADDALAASNPMQASEESLAGASSLADRRTGPSRCSDGASSSRLRRIRSAADGNGSLSRLARSDSPSSGQSVQASRPARPTRRSNAPKPSFSKTFSRRPHSNCCFAYARRPDGAVTGRDPFLSPGLESELCEGGSAASHCL